MRCLCTFLLLLGVARAPDADRVVNKFKLIEFVGTLGLAEPTPLDDSLARSLWSGRPSGAQDAGGEGREALPRTEGQAREESSVALRAVDRLPPVDAPTLLQRLAEQRPRYVLDDRFEGGSHGEIWRAHRLAPEEGSRGEQGRESYILKRLLCSRGTAVVRSGLREIFFGGALEGVERASVVRDFFIREEDSAAEGGFRTIVDRQAIQRAERLLRAAEDAEARGAASDEFLDRHEIWLVFEDGGTSMRRLLYEPIGDGLVGPSHLWYRLRTEEAAGQQQDTTLRRILRQLLTALSHVHARGAAHRDLKPSNVVVQIEGERAPAVHGAAVLPTTIAEPQGTTADAAPATGARGTRAAKPAAGAAAPVRDVMVRPRGEMSVTSPGAKSGRASREPLAPLTIRVTLIDFGSAAHEGAIGQGLFPAAQDGDLGFGLSLEDCTEAYVPPELTLRASVPWSAPETAAAAVETWQRADVWAVGVIWLELLLGSKDVFRLDQRSAAVLEHVLRDLPPEVRGEATRLAALADYCIYTPVGPMSAAWPTCTAASLAEAVRRRDDFGFGLGDDAYAADLLSRLLRFHPEDRIAAAEALQHAYFVGPHVSDVDGSLHATAAERAAHDARVGAAAEGRKAGLPSEPHGGEAPPPPLVGRGFPVPATYTCPECGRRFGDWRSCRAHARGRRHGDRRDGKGGSEGFCDYGEELGAAAGEGADLPRCEGLRGLLTVQRDEDHSGWCELTGRRATSEDYTSAFFTPRTRYFGVFDGHWGTRAARFASRALYQNIELALAHLPEGAAPDEAALRWAFQRTQAEFVASFSLAGDRSGATATMALLRNDTITVANIGDSRAVLCCDADGAAIQMSVDHTPENATERRRIEGTKDGFVEVRGGIPRLQGKLAVSRAFGDGHLREFGLSSDPFVMSRRRDARRDEFAILASDGLWDVLGNAEAVSMVRMALAEFADHRAGGRGPASARLQERAAQARSGFQFASERLALEAYVRGSTDNIGVLVIDLGARADADGRARPS